MGFPKVKYGICPFGGNTIENSTPTSGADAPVSAVQAIKATVLRWYPRLSRYVCQQCILRLNDDEKAIKANFGHIKEQEFRSKAGFLNYVPANPAPATYPPLPYPPADWLQTGSYGMLLDDDGNPVYDDDGNPILVSLS